MTNPKSLEGEESATGKALGDSVDPLLSIKVPEWCESTVRRIELAFCREWQGPDYVESEVDCQAKFLSLVLEDIIRRGFSGAEIVNVLFGTEMVRQQLRVLVEPATDELSVELENEITTIQASIGRELAELKRHALRGKGFDSILAIDQVSLYLSTSDGRLEAWSCSAEHDSTMIAAKSLQDIGLDFANLCNSLSRAISWDPARDPRVNTELLRQRENIGSNGPLCAIRLDDAAGQRVGVAVFSLRMFPEFSLRRLPELFSQEHGLSDELAFACSSLPNLIRNLRHAIQLQCLHERSQLARVQSGIQTIAGRQIEQVVADIDRTARTAHIERLYSKIAAICTEQDQEPSDVQLPARLRECISELRRLQRDEATAIEQCFLRGLSVPIGAGERILAETDEIIAKYANPPIQNGITEAAD